MLAVSTQRRRPKPAGRPGRTRPALECLEVRSAPSALSGAELLAGVFEGAVALTADRAEPRSAWTSGRQDSAPPVGVSVPPGALPVAAGPGAPGPLGRTQAAPGPVLALAVPDGEDSDEFLVVLAGLTRGGGGTPSPGSLMSGGTQVNSGTSSAPRLERFYGVSDPQHLWYLRGEVTNLLDPEGARVTFRSTEIPALDGQTTSLREDGNQFRFDAGYTLPAGAQGFVRAQAFNSQQVGSNIVEFYIRDA